MVNRKTQVGVTLAVWLVCLLGGAVALKLKGRSSWVTLPAEDPASAAEAGPAPAPPAETPAEAPKPPEPNIVQVKAEEVAKLTPIPPPEHVESPAEEQATAEVSKPLSSREQQLQRAEEAARAGNIDEAVRLYEALGRESANTDHDLSVQCFNKAQWLCANH